MRQLVRRLRFCQQVRNFKTITPPVAERIKEMIKHRDALLSELSVAATSSKEKQAKSRELSWLTSVSDSWQEYSKLSTSLTNLANELAQTKEVDLKTIIQDEINEIKTNLETSENALVDILLRVNEDSDHEKSVIVEIRPGTGGDEASIFANELFEMYMKLAKNKHWKFEKISYANFASTEGQVGIREACAQISGPQVYTKLKYDIGIHRVQRVPITEGSGRVHTSTASVVILPEAKESDIQLNPKDLKIDTYRAGGAGGQSVNKTDSAVRITHLPTGTVVSCQDERDQHSNKNRAMTVLMSRILQQQKLKLMEERSSERVTQMGDSDRSDKIRTYNFPQDRITDHRISYSITGIEDFLNGKEDVFEDLVFNMLQHDKKLKFDRMFAPKEQPKPDKKKK